MPGEGLTVFAHLSARDTERVRVYLIHLGLSKLPGIVYGEELDLLMTTTDQAKQVVMEVLRELCLLPKGETVLLPTV